MHAINIEVNAIIMGSRERAVCRTATSAMAPYTAVLKLVCPLGLTMLIRQTGEHAINPIFKNRVTITQKPKAVRRVSAADRDWPCQITRTRPIESGTRRALSPRSEIACMLPR